MPAKTGHWPSPMLSIMPTMKVPPMEKATRPNMASEMIATIRAAMVFFRSSDLPAMTAKKDQKPPKKTAGSSRPRSSGSISPKISSAAAAIRLRSTPSTI
ncbi:hypothetical protein D3C87_2011890 [compost metagenome]